MKEIIVFGAGGHAKVVIDVLLKEKKYKIAAVFSQNRELKTFQGIPHFAYENLRDLKYNEGIVAIGDNYKRSELVKQILIDNPEFKFISTIHPSAAVALDTVIGEGVVMMAGAIANSSCKIGNHVILNTNSCIDHDAHLQDFSSIAPGAILGGNCSVGQLSAISLGTNIIHGINIGEHSVIGAGALVLKDIPDYCVAYGSPCKEIRKRFAGEKYL